METHYALSGEKHIAYQVLGEGAMDVLSVPALLSNIELADERSAVGTLIGGVGRFARVVQFDRRGNGMSDGAGAVSTLEEQLDDVAAVVDAAAMDRPALISLNEGAALALLYAATYPEQVRALVLLTPQVRMVKAPGYEWALTAEQREAMVARVIREWGRASRKNPWLVFAGEDPRQRAAFARFQRLGMGPGDAEATLKLAGEIDVRHVLPSVQCPTLVLRRRDDTFLDARHSHYVADHVPDARYVELEGDTPVWVGNRREAAHEIELFLTGMPPPPASERLLATVLFTDIVASTELAGTLGDARWRELLLRHDAAVRDEVARGRGRVVKSLGDGALALFDGPTRAIETALALSAGAEALDLRLRIGLHAGECELMPEGDVGGLAVHIAARIAAMAGPGEILMSRTVRDLSVGSRFDLEDLGEQRLKGLDEPWRVYSVRGGRE